MEVCIEKEKTHTHTERGKKKVKFEVIDALRIFLNKCVFVDNIIARIGAGSSKDTIKCKYFLQNVNLAHLHTYTKSLNDLDRLDFPLKYIRSFFLIGL